MQATLDLVQTFQAPVAVCSIWGQTEKTRTDGAAMTCAAADRSPAHTPALCLAKPLALPFTVRWEE